MDSDFVARDLREPQAGGEREPGRRDDGEPVAKPQPPAQSVIEEPCPPVGATEVDERTNVLPGRESGTALRPGPNETGHPGPAIQPAAPSERPPRISTTTPREGMRPSTPEPTNPSQLAFDGLIQDWWNSGSYPPHWVEVDLQYPRTIGRVRLVSPQIGSDATVLLLGRSADDQPFRLLHTFKGPFSDLQEVDYAPKQPWRSVRYLRLEVGSANAWVSWREIEVYAPMRKAKKTP